ncbi:transporter, partial [Bacillus inaquosorum]|nr:transporter [Bacillus inaquosorum]
FIMMVVGLQVLFSAGESIFSAKQETPDMIAAWTAAGGAALMLVVYQYNKRLAKKVKSQ